MTTLFDIFDIFNLQRKQKLKQKAKEKSNPKRVFSMNTIMNRSPDTVLSKYPFRIAFARMNETKRYSI